MEFNSVAKLPIDVEAAVRKRVSIRNYEEKSLSEKDKTKLLDFSKTLDNPFGVDVRVQYLSKNLGSDNVKLGTYGTIKGAKDFLALTVKDVDFAMEAAGYQFENLILYATQMDLATVWLAGTFNRKDFKKIMELKDDDLFPCISPIGYNANKTSLLEKFTKSMLGSAKRKNWEDIFYLDNFSENLSKERAGEYALPLELFRLAPSATNAQPWAVVRQENVFHFFNNYKNNIDNGVRRIKHLDLGIGLAHFHQAAMSKGLDGEFAIRNIDFDIPQDMHYRISYIAK